MVLQANNTEKLQPPFPHLFPQNIKFKFTRMQQEEEELKVSDTRPPCLHGALSSGAAELRRFPPWPCLGALLTRPPPPSSWGAASAPWPGTSPQVWPLSGPRSACTGPGCGRLWRGGPSFCWRGTASPIGWGSAPRGGGSCPGRAARSASREERLQNCTRRSSMWDDLRVGKTTGH